MSHLARKDHWDSIHGLEEQQLLGNAPDGNEPGTPSLQTRTTRRLKDMLGSELLERMSGYDYHLLWNVLFPRFLPNLKGARVVEVGSAPGEFLVQFSKTFGCIPYGIEYSDVGVQVNRSLFSRNGFDPDNVIHTDFFSEEFRLAHKERFDVVISRGFVEHYSDIVPVIDRHIDLVAPGGYLLVSIPNLRGVNYALARLFHKEVIPLHNIEIMQRDAFAKPFCRSDLQTLFCDYYGTFSFYLFTSGNGPARYALQAGQKLQPLLNLAFRTFFKDRGAENPLLSPHILYVGRKLK